MDNNDWVCCIALIHVALVAGLYIGVGLLGYHRSGWSGVFWYTSILSSMLDLFFEVLENHLEKDKKK